MTDSFSNEHGDIVSATYYGLGEGWPLELLITVTFEDVQGNTKLTLRHSGIGNINETDINNMKEGWNQSFDKLADYLMKA